MSRPSALRAMIGKEVRTMLRERGQMLGIIAGLVAMLFGFAAPSYQAAKALKNYVKPAMVDPPGGGLGAGGAAARPVDTPLPQPPSREQMSARAGVSPEQLSGLIRWVVIAVSLFISVVVAIMFGTTMAIAAFVGEREANTVEVLLATPLTHHRLYILKCLSVVIPATVATTAIAAVLLAALFVFVADAMPAWMWAETLTAIAWAAPLPLIAVMLTNSLCVCASIRAETVKGAGQLVGVVMLVLLFPLILGPLFLMPRIPQLRDTLSAFFHWWLDASFVAQYGAMLAIAVGAAGVLFTVGYLRFNREKMLT